MIVIASVFYNHDNLGFLFEYVQWDRKLHNFIDYVKNKFFNIIESKTPKYLKTPLQVLTINSIMFIIIV